MNDDLSKIIDLISISKKTITNIKENLFWAFFYNVLMIPIAIGFFKSFGLSMSPMIAGLGMTLSSLFVVFNALRLKRIKKENI
jgi:cation transport ATPase